MVEVVLPMPMLERTGSRWLSSRMEEMSRSDYMSKELEKSSVALVEVQ